MKEDKEQTGNYKKLIGKKASAGSGKTFSLVLRYLQLLSEHNPSPEVLGSIIAITFTNKASAEMKERILRYLKEIAFETDFAKKVLIEKTNLTPEKAQKWIDIIINHYFDFQVRTIDSLLLSIFKGFSFELGIKPDSRVSFNEKKVFETVFEDLFTELAKEKSPIKTFWEKAIETFLIYDEKGGFYPENKLKKLFVEELLPKVAFHSNKEFLRVPEEIKKEFSNKTSQIMDIYKKLYSELENKFGGNIRNISKNLKNPYEITWEGLINWEEKESFFLENITPLKEIKDLLEELKKLSYDIKELYLNQFCYVKIEGYYDILKELCKKIDEKVKEEGLLLGSQHWTTLILNSIEKNLFPSLVYAYFGRKFKHFLIDEFQDTSRQHWNTLKYLIEEVLASEKESSLFVVGDPKQAIYAWRGGDWEIYHELFNKTELFFPCLAKEEIVEETLCKNYRSHPKLVEFFNKVFEFFSKEELLKKKLITTNARKGYKQSIVEYLMPSFSEPIKDEFIQNLTKTFKDHFQESVLKEENECCVIKCFEILGKDKEDILEVLKKRFLEEVKKEWKDSIKGYKNKTIAVLVRKNDEAEEISKWLFEEKIPVITENALRISICPKVKALISLLRLIENPEEELFAYGVLAGGILKNLYPEFPENEKQLQEQWIECKHDFLKKINSFLEEVKKEIPSLEPYEILWCIITKLNIKLENEPFIERLFELVHLYSCENGPSISGFLKFWDQGGAKEKLGIPENIKAVRVLTIHKAKGLEFDTVFLPFTNWYMDNPVIFELIEEDNKIALVHLGDTKKLPEELKILKARYVLKNRQEMLHLFYVALTRAKEKLFIFFPNSSEKGKNLSLLMQALIKEALKEFQKGKDCEVSFLSYKD